MNTITLNNDNVYFIGDIHGLHKQIRNWVAQNDLKDCALVFCGDFGLGFEKRNGALDDLQKVNKFLSERNVCCFAFRGNHDDPSYYDGENVIDLSHFKTLKDYTVIITPNHAILCIGGAISIDRQYRKYEMESAIAAYMQYAHKTAKEAEKMINHCYWEDEATVYNEDKLNEIINNGIKIDTVATHTAPTMCFPITSKRYEEWCEDNESLKIDNANDRNNLTKVFDYLLSHEMPLKQWFYGHFHSQNTEYINNVEFNLLDMGRASKKQGTANYFDAGENLNMKPIKNLEINLDI